MDSLLELSLHLSDGLSSVFTFTEMRTIEQFMLFEPLQKDSSADPFTVV